MDTEHVFRVYQEELYPWGAEPDNDINGAIHMYTQCTFRSDIMTAYIFPKNASKIIFDCCIFQKNSEYKIPSESRADILFVGMVPPLAKIKYDPYFHGKMIFSRIVGKMNLLGFRGFGRNTTVSFQELFIKKLDYRFFLGEIEEIEIINCRILEDIDEVYEYRSKHRLRDLNVKFDGNNSRLTPIQIKMAQYHPIPAPMRFKRLTIGGASLFDTQTEIRKECIIDHCTFLEGVTCYKMPSYIAEMTFKRCVFPEDSVIAFGEHIQRIYFSGNVPPLRNLNIPKNNMNVSITIGNATIIDCAGFLGFDTNVRLSITECYIQVLDYRLFWGYHISRFVVSHCLELYDVDELVRYAEKSPNLELRIFGCPLIPNYIIEYIESVNTGTKIHNRTANEIMPIVAGKWTPRLSQRAPIRKLPNDLIRMVAEMNTGNRYSVDGSKI